MKLFFCIQVLLLSIALISCQKGDDVVTDPIKVDSINALLPKQVIIIDDEGTSDPYTIVASIKYDTTNRQVMVYEDDTTNSTPYDVLGTSYQFNNKGYLVSLQSFDMGSIEQTYTINRGGDDKIIWIAHEDKAIDGKDTTFFSYEPVAGGTKITCNKYTYYQQWPPDSCTYLYTYSADNKIMQVQSIFNNSSSIADYTYNPNGSIKKIFFDFGDDSFETNFSYSSGLADGQEDIVLKTFLGKDYYIQNIRALYPLRMFSDGEYNTLSATDPYHVTRMQDVTNQNGQITTEERTYSYELNTAKLLSKLIVSFEGTQGTFMFKY
jgi:hypothetical protein